MWFALTFSQIYTLLLLIRKRDLKQILQTFFNLKISLKNKTFFFYSKYDVG